ncbi:MarR family transcriptional regulator [Amycolatopsis vancoresmycina]|uniref:Transcriptional regulator n=1 Tax=Amycolatopsis vancoresmycina DSM 44592 TaxID=1292037 RepID=R1I3X5_9PSEU|nr:MarR family transcriptional regulator [Amycolatopsis vancoresmycina]EOD67216.1 transcriptional regulator [Amycolatopsis vancoresmycina DSM 44592]
MNPEPTPAAQVWTEMLAFVTGQDRLRALRLELDLGVGKAELLIKLAEAPMTLREIAQAAEVDPSAATVAVDRLERRGLAERRANPGDKRSRLVHLTEAGLQAAAAARRILTEPPAALAALEAADLATLTRIFATMAAGLPGKDGGGRPR